MDQGNVNQSSDTRTPFGQRVLACIVFSDTVSFSEKMNLDEELTLSMVNADLKSMEEICVRNEGRVLKSTGDGLLMYFTSAVQAVTAAMEIQNGFAEREKKSAEGTVLIHRLGIHLGDVFLTQRDVMGDGVNIAARLEAQAESGGICISQTVYDVVKNKLDLQTIYHGPRELKNIGPVPVYEVLLTKDLAGSKKGQKRRRAKRKKGQQIPWLGIIGGVVAASLILTTFIITIMIIRPDDTENGNITSSPPGEIGPNQQKSETTPPVEPAGDSVITNNQKQDGSEIISSAGPQEQGIREGEGSPVTIAEATQPPPDRAEMAISKFMAVNPKNDRVKDPSGPSDTVNANLADHDFSLLKDWFRESITHYTRNRPLEVLWTRNNRNFKVKIWCPPYKVQSTVFMYRSRYGASSFRFDTIASPINKCRLIYSVLENEIKRGNPPSQEVFRDIMVLLKRAQQTEIEEKFINLLKDYSSNTRSLPSN